MSKYETLSAEDIAKRYRIFRVLRHIATAVFVLFVALDLFVIIFSLVNGIELNFALEYLGNTAKAGVLIIFCMLWFGIRDIAQRAGMSKIGWAYGDYEKSKQLYTILGDKIKNRKLRNYFRYMKARACAALKEYDEVVTLLNQQGDKHIAAGSKYNEYLLLEDAHFCTNNYAEFENVHSKSIEAAGKLGDKKYYKWLIECNNKLYDARKAFIDKDYENSKKLYDETLQILRQKEYGSLNADIALTSYEAAKVSFELGDTDDAYHKARTAVELGKTGWFAKEAEEMLEKIKPEKS